MKRYTTFTPKIPLQFRLSGQRPVELTTAVLEDGKPIAVFSHFNKALAYRNALKSGIGLQAHAQRPTAEVVRMRTLYFSIWLVVIGCLFAMGYMLNEGLKYRDARKAVQNPAEFTESQLSLCTAHLRRVSNGDDEFVRRLRSNAYWRGEE